MAAFVLACALSYTRAHEAYAQAPAAAPAKGGEYAAVVAQLRSPDIAARGAASAKLLKAGPAALPDILPQLSVQRMRVPLLRLIGDMGPKAVAELVRLTDDPVLGVPAADALSLVTRPNSFTQVPGLADCMLHHAELREMCGRGLVLASSRQAAAQVPSLLPLVKHADPSVRSYALLALGGIGPAAARAVPDAAKALSDPTPAVRVSAARALGGIGKATPEVREALKAAAAAPDRETALAAAAALRRLPKAPAAGAAPKPGVKPAPKAAPKGAGGKAK